MSGKLQVGYKCIGTGGYSVREVPGIPGAYAHAQRVPLSDRRPLPALSSQESANQSAGAGEFGGTSFIVPSGIVALATKPAAVGRPVLPGDGARPNVAL